LGNQDIKLIDLSWVTDEFDIGSVLIKSEYRCFCKILLLKEVIYLF